MKLELVSHALCPLVHRAAIMLREKGVSFDRRIVRASRWVDSRFESSWRSAPAPLNHKDG